MTPKQIFFWYFDNISQLWGYVSRPALMFCAQERPNHNNSTASRLLSEVKYCQALLVLQWGTMLESKVLFFLLYSLCSITWMTHEEGLNAGSIISQQSLAYNTVILQPKSLIGIGLWNGL